MLPFVPVPGLDAAVVEIGHDLRDRPPVEDPVEDLPDDGCGRFVDRIPAILSPLQAERRHAVDHALLRIVHQAAPDVLGHVFTVELVDVHHVPESEPAGCRVVEVLLGVEALDTVLGQLGHVGHGLGHVPADPVALPRDDVVELLLLGVLHQTLEGRSVIRPAGDGSVLVDIRDGVPVLLGVLLALGNLLFQ